MDLLKTFLQSKSQKMERVVLDLDLESITFLKPKFISYMTFRWFPSSLWIDMWKLVIGEIIWLLKIGFGWEMMVQSEYRQRHWGCIISLNPEDWKLKRVTQSYILVFLSLRFFIFPFASPLSGSKVISLESIIKLQLSIQRLILMSCLACSCICLQVPRMLICKCKDVLFIPFRNTWFWCWLKTNYQCFIFLVLKFSPPLFPSSLYPLLNMFPLIIYLVTFNLNQHRSNWKRLYIKFQTSSTVTKDHHYFYSSLTWI